MEIKFHSLIPPLTTEEFAELERSILAEGCRDALVTWRGILLDGHNRLRICREHDIPFETTEIELEDETAAKIWILRNQLARRNLSKYQRCEVEFALEEAVKEQARERQRQGGIEKVVQNSAQAGKARDQIAKAAGVSHDTYTRAKVIHEQGTEEQKQKLRTGETTINREYTAIRRREQEERNKQYATPALPTGRYDVIVIDPPWPMEKIIRDCAPNQAAFDYQTMALEEIESLSLPAADNCHLFCWTTQKFFPVTAWQIIKTWGFQYICTFGWHKPGGFQPFGLPQYNLEFAVYARKGTPKFIDLKDFSLCFQAPRGKHSEKPEAFYEMIRRVTTGKRLDMFSRRQIEGFDVWGNEV